jgi:4-hydroxy-2-oxoheptanedioate aldolase
MIETRSGVENLDAILQVPGVDWILEGALDLALSLGVGPDAQHPDVQQAIASVAQKTRRAGLRFCAIPRAPGQFEHWREQGVDAFLLGEDRGILFRRLRDYRQSFG